MTDWRMRAACRGLDVEAFFPVGTGGRTPYRDIETAMAACDRCPVVRACRDYAVEHCEHGIWGGTTEEQRKRLRRNRLDRQRQRGRV